MFSCLREPEMRTNPYVLRRPALVFTVLTIAAATGAAVHRHEPFACSVGLSRNPERFGLPADSDGRFELQRSCVGNGRNNPLQIFGIVWTVARGRRPQ